MIKILLILLSFNLFASDNDNNVNFISSFNNKNIEPLTYINYLRAKVGLIPMKRVQSLDLASKAHALYILNNRNPSHFEEKGKINFTGVTPNDRVKIVNYLSFVREGISYADFDELGSIDHLLSGIYHRFNILTFTEDEIGFFYINSKKLSAFVHENGYSGFQALCDKARFDEENYKTFLKSCLFENILIPEVEYTKSYQAILKKQPEYVIFPPNGSIDVPPAFFEESPHPMPGYKVSGYPISIQFNPNVSYIPDIVSAKLINNTIQTSVPVKIIKKDNDPNAIFDDYQFAIFPLERLDYNTKYELELGLKINGKFVPKTIKFQTIKLPYKIITIIPNNQIQPLVLSENIDYAFYVVPQHTEDVMKFIHINSTFTENQPDISYDFIDNNTFHFIMKNVNKDTKISIDLNNGTILEVTKK